MKAQGAAYNKRKTASKTGKILQWDIKQKAFLNNSWFNLSWSTQAYMEVLQCSLKMGRLGLCWASREKALQSRGATTENECPYVFATESRHTTKRFLLTNVREADGAQKVKALIFNSTEP